MRPDPAFPENIVETGARVYASSCAQCHGEKGGGDGSAAAELAIAPTNFRRQRPSLDLSLRALRNGVDGTPMAPWTSRLDAAEIVAVAHHVRGFFEAEAAR